MPDTLYIIDGHAQIFRAYYAIRGGMNSSVTGEPTQAVFGFTGMLLKLLLEFKPKYVIVAIDMPGKTFRDDLYPEYKATRQAPPADLPQQTTRCVEVTKLFGIPVFGVEGAEADDVIATIVKRVTSDPAYNDVAIRIVSKDKDLKQLLNDRVTMFDIQTDTTIDAAWVKENDGVTPAQIIDMLTLTGDSVDNVRGVDGIGPKTAAKLLAEYGTLDNLLAHAADLKGKLKENLEIARGHLPLSKTLVTLKDDVELDFDLSKARAGAADGPALQALFHQLGFRRHMTDLNRLLGVKDEQPATEPVKAAKPQASSAEAGGLFGGLFDQGDGSETNSTTVATPRRTDVTYADQFDYRAVRTRGELDQLVATLRTQPMISVDTETTGLGRRPTLVGISLAWKPGAGVYIPTFSAEQETHLDAAAVLDALRPVFEDPAIPKCGHNLKYDWHVLRHAGVTLRGVAFDSMIASFLLNHPSHGLDALALEHLKHEMIPISKLIGLDAKGKPMRTMDRVPVADVAVYAAEDADMALRLHDLFAPRLRLMGMEELARDVEMPLVAVLATMEHHGIRVDPDELIRQQKLLTKRIDELRDEIYEKAGGPFNIDSPKQLAELLFIRLGLPVMKKTKTGPSTDIEVLERLSELENVPAEKIAIPALIVEYRQLTKLVSTYLEALREAIDRETGRVHAQFHQTGAATGRLSSSNPNLQNIPIRTDVGRQIRKAFIAAPGNVLISADYSQIELRILAHLSDDPALIEAFRNDLDVHTAVASQVFGVPLDGVTKEQRNHAKVINFGIIYGAGAAGLARRIEGLDLAGAKKLIADYKTRFAGIDAFLKRCVGQAMNLGYVTTMLGRRRPIPELQSSNGATRSLGERLAINSVVQGTAADLIKQAMVNLQRRIEAESLPLRMLLQIHDELVLECPEPEGPAMGRIVQQAMEGAMQFKVPLKVEVGIGPDWLAAK